MEQGDGILDDFQHDDELASSIQGLLQQSEGNPVKLLRANPDMAEATRKAAKVGCVTVVWSSGACLVFSSEFYQQFFVHVHVCYLVVLSSGMGCDL